MTIAVLFARADSVSKQQREAERKAEWRRANADRVRAQDRARREKNRDHIKAQQAAWTTKNKARVLELQRAWAAANPEKKRAVTERYRLAHPEKYRVYAHNRRAKVRENGGELSSDLAQRCAVKEGVDV